LFFLAAQVVAGLWMAVSGPEIVVPEYFNRISEGFWNSSTVPNQVAPYHRWIFAVLGSTMAAWSFLAGCLVLIPFREKKRWAFVALSLSLLLWFPVDTWFSVSLSVWPNVLVNVVAMAGMGLPLWLMRREFFPVEVKEPSATVPVEEPDSAEGKKARG